MSKTIGENYLEPSLIELNDQTFKVLLNSPWLSLGCEDHLLELILHWYLNNYLINNDSRTTCLIDELLRTKIKWT